MSGTGKKLNDCDCVNLRQNRIPSKALLLTENGCTSYIIDKTENTTIRHEIHMLFDDSRPHPQPFAIYATCLETTQTGQILIFFTRMHLDIRYELT